MVWRRPSHQEYSGTSRGAAARAALCVYRLLLSLLSERCTVTPFTYCRVRARVVSHMFALLLSVDMLHLFVYVYVHP